MSVPKQTPASQKDNMNIDQWARILLTGILLSMVGFGITGIYSQGVLSANVQYLSENLSELTAQVRELIRNDVADIKGRLITLEQREMLPATKVKIQELEADLKRITEKLPN